MAKQKVEVQFDTIHGMFKFVKKDIFMKTYSDIRPSGGFNHRFSGKLRKGKPAQMDEDDVLNVLLALDKFIIDCQELRKNFVFPDKI